MAELLDYSWDRLTPAQIRAAGRVGVIRYVASGRAGVTATRTEVDSYRAAGLTFCGVWQRGDTRPLGGYLAGQVDAHDAKATCTALGANSSDPVYFAVDFDPTSTELVTIADYFHGVADVLGWARVGAYGGLPTLNHLRNTTPIGLFWQTVAWSAGQLAPYANLYQYAINQTINGKAVDYNRSLTDYYGQWGTPMPALYPGARWKPLGAQTQQPMARHDIICLHTMVGYLVSTDGYFRAGNGAGYIGLESHFGVAGKWGPDLGGGLDGAVWQWQDCDHVAEANGEGNWRLISVETADNAPQRPDDIEAWTPAQCDALVDLCVWLCRRYDIPPVLIADTRPGSRGIGWHAQGTAEVLPAGAERWSPTVGKPCPTARRITQIRNVIIPRVRAALVGEEDPFMALSDAEQGEVLAAARQVNGATGPGQTTFAGTMRSTLGTVQALVNLINAKTGTLGKAITDSRGAVLAGIAALPTDQFTVEDRAALAVDIVALVNQQGINVDGDAVIDALAERLNPAPVEPVHG